MCNNFFSFTVILDIYKSFILNKTTSTKYWVLSYSVDIKPPGSFKIDWVRQYIVHVPGLADIVNPTVFKT